MINPNIFHGNASLRKNRRSEEIRSYSELQEQMHRDLLRQHPEWIDSNGHCPTCDEYDRRFAELISIFKAASLECAQRAA
jgi:hypothetical protein